jgi:sugar phosphate isomerase/epimerase
MRVALQLWTVREHAERDMPWTLRQLAGLGYSAVELAGLGNTTAQELRQALDQTGIEVLGAHVPLRRLTDSLSDVIHEMHTIGCSQVALPSIPPDDRAPLDRVVRLAETCNTIAARLQSEGIAFAYHNEDYDFLPLGDTTLWQAMVTHTDPSLVQLQLDIFTAILMHADPIAMMRDHGDRVTSIHLCDMREGAYVPVGEGMLDWPAILAAAQGTAARWLIVEHDAPPNPFADAATSLRHLQELLQPNLGTL